MSKETFIIICAIALMAALWPILKWLVLIILVIGIVLFVIVSIQSKKTREEIEKDPKAYFAKQNVIEAEYKEKEVEEAE